MTRQFEDRPAVFLDRDGTLNVEYSSYVRNPDGLEVFSYAASALTPLVERDIPLILVSNQAGVGKGLMTSKDLEAVELKLRRVLAEGGVSLAAAYYCIHTDEDNCSCRKPKGGMLKKAAKDLGVDLANSFFVGDSWRDMAAGRDAGVSTVFVPTGINPLSQLSRVDRLADYIAEGLEDAVRWICEKLDDQKNG